MLKIRSFGLKVRKLQQRLNKQHFKVGRGFVTGYFGTKTELAVIRFQAAFGLNTDGLVGPKTYAALDKDGQLSPHFHVDEFASKGNGNLILDRHLINKLEDLRKALVAPIHINSGYRDPAYNRQIGGAYRSWHMRGMAADIMVKGVSPKEVFKKADELYFDGIHAYRNFTHVDVRGYRARW